MDEKLVRRMMSLFEGYDKAYGSYDAVAAMSDMRGGKVEIKSTAFTKKKAVTLDLWRDHLMGKRPLGIIPIRDNNTCLWGCIDIDDYGINPVELVRQIDIEKLPLICCKTKSGGIHVYLFMKDPIDAGQMQIGLRNIAAVLRHGSSEIFPKQRKVALEKGDLGSWLNMPYFGEDRHGYKPDGTFMTLEEFLDHAEALAQDVDWFDQDKKKKPTETSSSARGGSIDFKDGPPCMQHLSAIGIGEGARNNGVYAFGIFAKKKYGVHWQEQLEQWNRDFAQPPLPAMELVDIIKRLGTKDYNYPCKDQPIVAHCNSAVCRTRKYGVGGSANEMPVISGLAKLTSNPPVWFMDVMDFRVELTTDQLLNYRNFQKVCVDELGVLFNGMTQKAWTEVISPLISDAYRIEVSDEVGNIGQFNELLDEFLNDSHIGEKKEDILIKMPWLDDTAEDPKEHRYYFRLKDLQKFLNDANFKLYTRGQLTSRLKALHGGDAAFNLNKKFTRVWWVPYNFTTHREGRVGSPPLEEEPI